MNSPCKDCITYGICKAIAGERIAVNTTNYKVEVMMRFLYIITKCSLMEDYTKKVKKERETEYFSELACRIIEEIFWSDKNGSM